ncbi:hypothetical protein [Neobacillus niacini]|uniref:hypothetical protein n=1 Tax=Neobacillus niacini TaxID=86668 RepID=UPI002863A7A0|nr:hypothetical protein [Neobacillus niacini]MDR6998519.1 beta-lactamase superfamily II metal-dependent hydrolase [Neobacillus niacini]
MRILLILITLFLQNTSLGFAASLIPDDFESIDLKLKDHEMAVSFLGLTNGEATLIQGPNDENILVDTGGEGVEAELDEWLRFYGVKEINSLILTNKQGLNDSQINHLISKYFIKEIVTTREISGQLSTHFQGTNLIPIKVWGEGTSKQILPEALANVLFAGNEQDEGLDFTLKFHKHRLFFMTSYSQRSQQMLLKKNLGDIKVFKVPMMKEDNSLSEKLIHTVNPQISILFSAEKNSPDIDIIQDLQDSWSEVYFTKKQGTVTIKFTQTNYEVFNIPIEEDEKS